MIDNGDNSLLLYKKIKKAPKINILEDFIQKTQKTELKTSKS